MESKIREAVENFTSWLTPGSRDPQLDDPAQKVAERFFGDLEWFKRDTEDIVQALLRNLDEVTAEELRQETGKASPADGFIQWITLLMDNYVPVAANTQFDGTLGTEYCMYFNRKWLYSGDPSAPTCTWKTWDDIAPGATQIVQGYENPNADPRVPGTSFYIQGTKEGEYLYSDAMDGGQYGWQPLEFWPITEYPTAYNTKVSDGTPEALSTPALPPQHEESSNQDGSSAEQQSSTPSHNDAIGESTQSAAEYLPDGGSEVPVAGFPGDDEVENWQKYLNVKPETLGVGDAQTVEALEAFLNS